MSTRHLETSRHRAARRSSAAASGIATALTRPCASCSTALPESGTPIGDTVLAVYKPTSSGFQQVACDDDSGDGNYSRLEFNASAETNYWIQVSGYNQAQGNFWLYGGLTLANDSFANARKISPGFSDAFHTGSATTQGNEPIPQICTPPGNVWFKYKPSQSKRRVRHAWQRLRLRHDRRRLPRHVDLNLTFITCSDDAVSPLGPSVVSWQAQADKTYYIQVGGYSNDVGQLVVSFTKQP